jgi:DNA-binding response OmpR family regulator
MSLLHPERESLLRHLPTNPVARNLPIQHPQPCPHCEDLRAQVQYLESELGIRRKTGELLKLNRAFGMTTIEAAITVSMSRRTLTVLSPNDILEASAEFAIATRGSCDPEGAAARNLASVYICHIRKKLGGKDTIRNLHGRGYALSPAARDVVLQVLAQPA